MLVDKIDKCAEENGESFTATRRCIDKTTFTLDDMLPCFLLECKWMLVPRCKPIPDDLITCSALQFHFPYISSIFFRSSSVLISSGFLSFRHRLMRGNRKATPDL